MRDFLDKLNNRYIIFPQILLINYSSFDFEFGFTFNLDLGWILDSFSDLNLALDMLSKFHLPLYFHLEGLTLDIHVYRSIFFSRSD